MADSSKVSADREILVAARERGGLSVFGAFVRLSGPGWLQSAITLGGGSLTGALFLGVLGGTSMLWLQLVAIIMGVVMLSAISYVTLSTGKRPFQAINEYINPVLGCGWLLATSAANMIWCMPQFSLSFDALDKNLVPGGLGPEVSDRLGFNTKLGVSAVLFTAALILVILNERRGLAARIFDLFLKALVGMIVICFFGVVIKLIVDQGLDWQSILAGFIPNLNQWSAPTGTVVEILQEAPEAYRGFWSENIVTQQRDVMIGAAATAVGINMTFLLPYSMLARGWDKPFRGLARFDLSTGMAIPYVIVTSCVVIAAAFSFHGKVDEAFLSSDPAVMQTSDVFKGAVGVMTARVQKQLGIEAAVGTTEAEKEQWKSGLSEKDKQLPVEVLDERFADALGIAAWDKLSSAEQDALMAELPAAEKRLAGTLVKRNAFQLAQSLAPLLGDRFSKVVFGLGVLGMGFSSIIILMLINGYVFRELAPARFERSAHILGCIVAGTCGALWPLIWTGESQFWLAILTSTFGMMLLPIAYITFFFMMNNHELLGDEKPEGASLVIWNLLMGISVAGALVAAGSAMWQKMGDPVAGPTVIGIAVFFALMVLVGFAARPSRNSE
jgi:Mn2+/Fe2+ NRAMP family transporter